MVGGRHGRPIRVPNKATKQGFTMKRAYWSWTDEEEPPSEVPGEDGRYILTELAGKLVYLYEAPDPSDAPAPVVTEAPHVLQARAWIRSSVGNQRFWIGRL